jgi:protein-S-isoprenylcysteine O-methyltransferase Ste14
MQENQRIFTFRVIFQLLLFIVLIPFLPLLISQKWNWWEAWVYAICAILTFVISRLLAAKRHPDIINERAKIMQHEDIQPWDKQLAPLLGISGIVVMVVAGLDQLFEWSTPYDRWIKIIALIIMLAGYVLVSYAFIENRFFSAEVRLQIDRGHQVVSTGPYRWIRHPGYSGGILTYLVTPLFLDSLWAFLPTLLVVALVVMRTKLEDNFLLDELLGYREYAKQVRYRLLPGVW